MFVLKKNHEAVKSLVEFYKGLNLQNNKTLDKQFALNAELKKALQDILAQETPAPNATVTRVLNIARKALGV